MKEAAKQAKTYRIRGLQPKDRNWIADRLDEHWGSTRVVSRGTLHYAHTLPGFTIVDENDQPQGLVTYSIKDKECEIVTLNSFNQGIGVGNALIQAVKDAAESEKCRRVWLITTNDNTPSLRYWQKRGFHIIAVHREAVIESRRLKPEIPLLGLDSIPIRHEIELEVRLKG
jgi:N-acetylglutamate synthase-like GNAT family acetyltransferase